MNPSASSSASSSTSASTPALPAVAPANPVQRWVFDRSAARYARLPEATRGMAMARDAFVFSRRGLGLWLGTACGIAGTTYGIAAAPSRVAPWFALLIAAALFFGLWKVGLSVWLRPERFTARKLWRGAALMMLATYAGALASFSRDLRALMAAGAPWYEAAAQVAWRATSLQIMLAIAGLLLLTVVSSARREYLQRALEQSRAEQERDAAAAQLTQARLTLLQAQIQPHFLFNTLAALQHWVDTGDARAAPLLRSLTAFLRGSTAAMLQPEVTVAQECEMARHYLEIMRSRLGDRLRYTIDVAPESSAWPLPPGIALTLVENAIGHGIEPQLRGGEVRVESRMLDGAFELHVRDDGAGLTAGSDTAGAPGHTGVGLANCRERLRHRFGDRAVLSLARHVDGPGTDACLRIARAGDRPVTEGS